MKAKLKVHKLFEYTNSKDEKRIGLTLKADMGLIALSRMGSVTLSKDVTMEQAEAEFPIGAEIDYLAFGEKEADSDFYEVVPA